jgi:hypothetical protein
MKIITAVFVTLSLFTGIAASLAPASAKDLAKQLEAEGRFGHSI